MPAFRLAEERSSSSKRLNWLAAPLLVTIIVALFARDARDMASIWWNSSTYQHCLFILPIFVWLVWQRRWIFARLEPHCWPSALLWIASGALFWLVGETGGVALPRHLGLVIMAQGAIATMLGRGVTAALLFPLFYLVFLVPAGDAIVPSLQTMTARMCLNLLHLARVPASLDGVFVTTPGGWFKIAEACSGAKFLIAMIALGVLAAHLGFQSWIRRAVFLGVCVVVPVLANGVRAFGTIYLAQFRGLAAAAAFDHIVYGWFFFAIVIALIFAVSSKFFDRRADGPFVNPDRIARQAALQRYSSSMPILFSASLAIALVSRIWGCSVLPSPMDRIASTAHLPTVVGWTQIAQTTGPPWTPRFDGADRLLIAHYLGARGAQVDLAVALYASQSDGHSLVGYGHGSVDPDSPWSWASDGIGPVNGKAEHITSPGGSREVVTFYRVGSMQTGSPARVKLETLRRHLTGGTQRASALLISALDRRGGRMEINHFMQALGPIGPLLDRIAEGR